jgi:tRNA pseudouridine13 synthase
VTPGRSIPPVRTASLPEVGGRLGPEPEDFVVDEIPAYVPSGKGEHAYLRIEKRSMTTRDAALALARVTGVSERDVGYAGMKDKHGVTTQWFSVPGHLPEGAMERLPAELRVVEASRHANKLRTGHLRGNRFVLGIVDAPADGGDRARALLAALTREGLLNAFGAQRFGRGGENLSRALAWVRGETRLPRSRERFLAKLYSSALQAEAFNRYAIARSEVGFEALLVGEVVRLAGAGSHFVVEDADREGPRYLAGDIVLTGPLPGPKLRPTAKGRGLELEERIVAELGLTERELAALGRHAPGTRRDLVVRPEHAEVRVDGNRLWISFELPAGSYATEVLREMLRTNPFESD